MSARDDYPCYAHDADSDMAMIENGVLMDAYNEIDRLRYDRSCLIARRDEVMRLSGTKVSEVSRLRDERVYLLADIDRLQATVFAFSRLCGCESDCEYDGTEIVHRPCCFRWEP